MINKHQYTLTQVEEIIDKNLESEQNFMFVADFALAHHIYDYIENDWGIEAECVELYSDVDEYYISLNFYNSEINFVCEVAKCNNGTYKYDEVDNVEYFVFTDMAFGTAREYLSGTGSIEFCEFVEEDVVPEDNCQCDCCECDHNDELEDWQKQIIDIVEDFADRIENDELCDCGCTLRNMLADLFYQARQIGFEDGVECGIESVKEKTVNITIDNIHFPNVTRDAKDFIEGLKEFCTKIY